MHLWHISDRGRFPSGARWHIEGTTLVSRRDAVAFLSPQAAQGLESFLRADAKSSRSDQLKRLSDLCFNSRHPTHGLTISVDIDADESGLLFIRACDFGCTLYPTNDVFLSVCDRLAFLLGRTDLDAAQQLPSVDAQAAWHGALLQILAVIENNDPRY